MKKNLRRIYKVIISDRLKQLERFVNTSGSKHKCNICGSSFGHFIKYQGGNRNIPEFRKKLDLVDSDRDNFGCPCCPSYDRERHLFMFFDALDLWEKVKSSRILHFAPEYHFSARIKSLNPKEYIMADYNPRKKEVQKVDATNIPFEKNSFDWVICNHVLEHIIDYRKAMEEIYRLLVPGGIAILQTPFSKILKNNFEDSNINTEEQRLFFYGEKDHFRIFSEEQFFDDLKETGFELKIIRNSDLFSAETCRYYGVNNREDLIQVVKN